MPARAPKALIVSGHEWAARALEAVLAPRGYAVVRAYTAAQGVERAGGADPDVVFIDRVLPDSPGAELCHELTRRRIVSPAAALMLLTSGPTTREQRLEGMRLGAWEVLGLPSDGQELMLRVEKYVRAKIALDRAREDGLVDAATGLYTREGLARRVRELSDAADRRGRPVTCVVLSATADEAGVGPGRAARWAEALRATTRKSDVLGRIGPAEFVVVTPETPPEGAEVLAARLRNRGAVAGGVGPVARAQVQLFDRVAAAVAAGAAPGGSADPQHGPASAASGMN
jgi:two-component system, cell cycle response regulator